MPQDRMSGMAGHQFGKAMAPLIARKLNTQLIGARSNECWYNGELAVIKTSGTKTSGIVVTYRMLNRVKMILAAFQTSPGLFSVYQLSADSFKSCMVPSKSAQHVKENSAGIVGRSQFINLGEFLTKVQIQAV